jgi:hypothetical protein
LQPRPGFTAGRDAHPLVFHHQAVYHRRNGFNRGAFVSLDHFVSVFSAVIAFAGLLLVAVQMRSATRQRESESLVKIYDINRELLTLGFSYPELFAILQDAENADPASEQHYLQLWLNQLSLIHLYLGRTVSDNELQEFLESEIADFMALKNMQHHWEKHGASYPASFQKLVGEIMNKGEPPRTTARHDLSRQNLAGDFLERRAGHPHEGFAARRGQGGVLGGSRSETLDEHIAAVGEDGGRAGAVSTECRKLPVFPNYFLDSHNVIFRLISLLKQNCEYCFIENRRGAFV